MTDTQSDIINSHESDSALPPSPLLWDTTLSGTKKDQKCSGGGESEQYYYSFVENVEIMATLRQTRVAQDLLENVGKPIGKAMLDAGYSPATADNPDHLTDSKGWQELMAEYFPDLDLAKVGKEGLNATKVVTSPTEPDRDVPDYLVRYKYWETLLKMKRHLAPEGGNVINADKVLVIPGELMEKYGITPNTKDSSS